MLGLIVRSPAKKLIFSIILGISLCHLMVKAEVLPQATQAKTSVSNKTAPEDMTPEEIELNSGSAQKTKWEALIIRESDVTKQIPHLRLINAKIPVFLVQKDTLFRPLVAVEFESKPVPGRVLVAGQIPLAQSRDPRKKILYAYLGSKKK